jgi:hypothetical protein
MLALRMTNLHSALTHLRDWLCGDPRPGDRGVPGSASVLHTERSPRPRGSEEGAWNARLESRLAPLQLLLDHRYYFG